MEYPENNATYPENTSPASSPAPPAALDPAPAQAETPAPKPPAKKPRKKATRKGTARKSILERRIEKLEAEKAEQAARLAALSSPAPPAAPDPAPAQEPKPRKKATTPWKPASILHVDDKDPNYNYKWCRRDTLDKRLAEGWEPVSAKSGTKAGSMTLIDGTQLNNLICKRNLVLCRIPRERAKAREEYFSRKTESAVEAQLNEYKGVTRVPGSGNMAYGNIKIKQGS